MNFQLRLPCIEVYLHPHLGPNSESLLAALLARDTPFYYSTKSENETRYYSSQPDPEEALGKPNDTVRYCQ